MKPNKEKQNLFETENSNIKWNAGGKGICAFSSLWVLFEINKAAQTMKAADISVWTKPASGGWIRRPHFNDAHALFDLFWGKIKGKVFPLTMDDNQVQKLLDAAYNEPETLDTLLEQIKTGVLDNSDWSSLPIFGGETPASTLGVWSWDATRLLVGTCADDMKIVNR